MRVTWSLLGSLLKERAILPDVLRESIGLNNRSALTPPPHPGLPIPAGEEMMEKAESQGWGVGWEWG